MSSRGAPADLTEIAFIMNEEGQLFEFQQYELQTRLKLWSMQSTKRNEGDI